MNREPLVMAFLASSLRLARDELIAGDRHRQTGIMFNTSSGNTRGELTILNVRRPFVIVTDSSTGHRLCGIRILGYEILGFREPWMNEVEDLLRSRLY